MSFLDKIADNKGKVLGGLGVAAVFAVVGYLYKSYASQDQSAQIVEEQQNTNFDLDSQIQKIKKTINLANPTLEEVKAILTFSLNASKKQIFSYSKKFKKDRKKYNKQKRSTHLAEYLALVSQGMNQIQRIGITLQQQIMTKLGINQQIFAKYQHQLGPFLQQQMMSQGMGSENAKQLSIVDVKKAVNLQVQYIRIHGDQLVDKLLQACGNWSPQQKSGVPALLSVYIADEVFQDHPQIDQDDLQGAQMKFQHQLQNEMYQLQQVMGPMMAKLSQGLGLGYGGMGGMGGMEGMGGMQGMGGITMQQLEQLQMQDPAAFEQLMQMMGGMQ